jgi:lysophospholipase L1-like esterase
VTIFRRYVAIGDSTTEGLDDPDGAGGYRGWADRLAEIIANAQAEPLNYANLGVRSLYLSEIRATQFDAALAMPIYCRSSAGPTICCRSPATSPGSEPT